MIFYFYFFTKAYHKQSNFLESEQIKQKEGDELEIYYKRHNCNRLEMQSNLLKRFSLIFVLKSIGLCIISTENISTVKNYQIIQSNSQGLIKCPSQMQQFYEHMLNSL